ncbi:MAG: polysaccharide biosynthesis C-terminal domain-containing protein [Bacteroidia bacterium]|nr:polysaccharide biosynthesis C-terminal domain-containing protein [Bacteroidia bacterium]
MIGSIKSTFKDSAIYGFGNIAVKLVGLVLIPIYTDKKYFSTEEFGIIGMLDVSGLVLLALLSFSLPQSFNRWFWDKEHKDNQKGIFFITFVSQIIVSLALCIILIPLAGTFSKTLFHSTDWTQTIILLTLASAIQGINNIISSLMRLQSRSMLYSITNIIKLVIVLILTLYFILAKKMGIEGIYLAQVIANSIYVLLLAGYTVKNCKIFFSWKVLREMNSYGFPLFIAGMAAVFLIVIDRFSLNSMSVLKSVALYTLAFKVSSVIKLVLVDSVKLAILPTFLKKMDSPDNKRFYSKILTYTSLVIMFAIVCVSLFSMEIIKLISTSKDLWGAIAVVPILSLAVFFSNMREVTIYGLHIAKKSRTVGSIVVVATIIGLALNILLIPRWDIAGAAVATLLSQAIYWLGCYLFAQKAFYVPYELKKMLILFIVGALFAFSSLFLNDLDLALRLTIKFFLVILFPFVIYIFNFYDRVEINAIKGFVQKWSVLRNLKNNLMSLKDIKDED